MRKLIACVALWFALPAAGQAFDLYGFNPKAISMGGVQAAADGDFTAVHYNPALLRGGSVGVGFNWSKPSFDVRPVGDAGLPSVLMPTDYANVTFGASVPLGGLL